MPAQNRKLANLILALACLSAPIAAQASDVGVLTPQAPKGWADGRDGTISTLAELQWLSETVTAWDEAWTLVANIDASATVGWNGGSGFSPIGDEPNFGVRQGVPFTGSFDGQGFEISGLHIARSGEPYVGMFGQITGGSVVNLSLVGGHVEGYRYVGGLIGSADYGVVVTECSFDGEVSAEENVGGLVGQTYQDIDITWCSSTGTVTGDLFVGGLVGDVYSHSTVANCISTTTVNGVYYAGGLAGTNRWFSSIDVSYTHGTVIGSSHLGGLVGVNDDSTINDCYSASDVDGDDRVGGLVGLTGLSENFEAGVYRGHATGDVQGQIYTGGVVGFGASWITDCYFDIETTNTTTGIGNTSSGQTATGLTTAEFADASNFLNWDFGGIWIVLIESDISPALRPYLRWQAPTYYTLTFAAEEGGSVLGETTQLLTPGSDSVPVVAVENEGYDFVEWRDDLGNTYSVEDTLVVLDVGEDGAFTAAFQPAVSVGEPDPGSDPLAATQLQVGGPNPFRRETSFRLSLAAAGPANLAIFDARGRMVRTLQVGELGAGVHEVTWDGTDDQGNPVAAGIYLGRLEADQRSMARKIIRLR